MPKNLKSQKGYLLYIAVLLIAVIGFIGVSVSRLYTGSAYAELNYLLGNKALYMAEAGIEHATHELLAFTITNRSTCSGLSLSNTLAGGAYTVTGSGPFIASAAAFLNGALTNSATTILVDDTSAYQSSGRIMIDKEKMNYASLDATHFYGVIRAVDGTIAATHATGTPVGQYQCNLTSSGGSPNLTVPSNPGNPVGKRVLTDTVQLQEGWASGDASASGNFTLMHWNSPTEATWNNASFAGGGAQFDINSLFMVSNADIWWIGDSRFLFHTYGNATAIIDTAITTTPVVFNSVYCNASNDCVFAGNKDPAANRPLLGRWNGTTWTQGFPATPFQNNLKSIHCSSSTNCWAVGDSTGAKRFYLYNGTWTTVTETALNAFPYNGVFCNAVNDCWAVGNGATFARKNAATWADLATGLVAVQYNSIYCTATNNCWAVGNPSGGRDVMVRWNGASWTRDASNPTPIANLYSVGCTTASDCWAVGGTSVGNNPAFIHWDGTNWTTFSPAGMPTGTILRSVSLVGHTTLPLANWSENYG